MTRMAASPMLVAGAAGCVLAPPLMAIGVASPVRVAAALLLFCVAPGAALLRRPDPIVVLGTSLAVSVLVAQAMLTLHLWSPAAATWLLAIACVGPIALRLRRTA